jgi:formate-dependent nitrite reductase cytochrome c552 subunit
MKKAKPIFLVGLHISSADPHKLEHITEELSEKLKDYYVVVYHQTKDKDPVFNVFYDKNFLDVNYKELKDLIFNTSK